MSKRTREKKTEDHWDWKWHKTCIVGSSTDYYRSKIASFDMDSTLIETKSGATFAKDEHDWVFWHESVPAKMKELYDNEYKIVIFTNQKGIGTGKTGAKEIQNKIETITAKMGV